MKNIKKEGISLIILVVTIIVIIILAGAVILSLTNNNPIEEAKEATFKSNIESYNSEITLYVANEYTATTGTFKLEHLNKNSSNIKTDVIKTMKNIDVPKFEIQKGILVYVKDRCTTNEIKWLTDVGIKEKNIDLIIPVSTWDKPYIPKGFNKSTVAGETEVLAGLVIKDNNNGNEFVWIPVKDFSKFSRIDYGKQHGVYANYLEETWDGISIVTELDKIYASVQKNGGYYIARYEAGLSNITVPATANHNTVCDGTIKPVSKPNVSPWNYIPWGLNNDITKPGNGAVTVARSMYKTNTDIQSTLIYGVQWDAALEFIKNYGIKDTVYPTDSTNKGNYNSSLKITGLNISYKLNNIYDMAGNTWEWIMEANSTGRVLRGGDYNNISNINPASYRISIAFTDNDKNCGFRPSIYIK